MHANHTQSLQIKHAQIDEKITAESQRPFPDSATISFLKKQKLKIKEELLTQ